jgi:hypothetical protein
MITENYDVCLCKAIDKMIIHFHSNKDLVGLQLYLHQMIETDGGSDVFLNWFHYSIINNNIFNIMFILKHGLIHDLPCYDYSIIKTSMEYPAIWYYLIKTICINYHDKEWTDKLERLDDAIISNGFADVYNEDIPYSVIKHIINIGILCEFKYYNYFYQCEYKLDKLYYKAMI